MVKQAVRDILESGVNIFLRGITLASKFLLLIYLAKVLEPKQLGVYGLFTASISYSLYLLGFDFYTYAQREMFSLSRTAWLGIVRNQCRFYALAYLIVLPLLLIVFYFGMLPWTMIGWFYLIMSFEHISQELCRLLVACGKVTTSNIALFFRFGAWVFTLLVVFRVKPELHSLTAVWAGWSAGIAVSIMISCLAVRRVLGKSEDKFVADWSWIRRGIKVASQFLVGTLALRGLFTFDRYFLDLYAGKSAVGIYSFYMSLANSVLAFADAGVISRLYPRIVSAYRLNKYDEYLQQLKNMSVGVLILYVTFAFGLLIFIRPVLVYIGREIYLEQTTTLWVLLAAMGVYSLGLVPHYALYAQGADRILLVANILSLLIFICSAVILTPKFGSTGMAVSVLVGVVCLGVVKILMGMRYRCFYSPSKN